MKRRLLFFLDGSGASAAGGRYRDATNVFRLNVSLHYEGIDGVPQIVFYSPGVGTRGDLSATATARGIDQTVREAYVNLASNYNPGDEVYIFGCSRGGVAARALTGMLSTAGLVDGDHVDRLWAVWELFLSDPTGNDQETRKLRQLIDDYRWPDEGQPKVEFLGLFDSVPGTQYDVFRLFSNVRLRNLKLDARVKTGVQLLSMDDTRIPSFKPLLWDGPATGKSVWRGAEELTDAKQIIEQIWIPGVHGDVGGHGSGGYLSDVSLLTMIDRIKRYCANLRFDEPYVDRLIEKMRSHNEIIVSDERPDIWRKALMRGQREIGVHDTERMHPVLKVLRGERCIVRGGIAEYSPPNFSTDIPEIETRYDLDFAKSCRSALSGMK